MLGGCVLRERWTDPNPSVEWMSENARQSALINAGTIRGLWKDENRVSQRPFSSAAASTSNSSNFEVTHSHV